MIDPLSPLQQIYNVDDGIAVVETRQRYRYAFDHFLKYAHKDPRLLLQQTTRSIENQIIDYIRFLSEEKHHLRGTINVAVCAIFHFFEMNDVVLNKRKVKHFMPSNESAKDDRAYTHEEIRQMLLKCDQRSRVVILLMGSTGMRIGALPGLQIGNLMKIPQSVTSSLKSHYHIYITVDMTFRANC
jgi:integrase